ncbi:hypothetical protein [Leifsonia sp. Leaf264]|uniref:hypothetical protein n=1 Tax=Leifsonia sp. Leaf264 TaxID=1736314 RepID=UPI0006F4A46F|nr:hypothetical protein [Leifsonia sp. Leaf264]KQO98194.1 hypothetical protein ASF30_09035 [Leifsonia sp. Leaf264]
MTDVALPLNKQTLAALERQPSRGPVVGELWGVGRHGDVEALALVTLDLGGMFFLAVPVIPVSGWATPSELILPDDVLGVEGTVVFNAESGIPSQLFLRNLAPVITVAEAEQLRAAMQHDLDLPTPLERGAQEHSAESVLWLDSILEGFRAITLT